MVVENVYFFSREALYRPQVGDFFSVTKGDGDTLSARSSSTTNSVHVAFGDVWEIVVDHVAYPIHVDSAGSDIGGDKDVDLSVLERC